MQPFPHPSDATHKFDQLRLANWLQRYMYSSLKVWTTTDGPLVYDKLKEQVCLRQPDHTSILR